MPTGSLKRSIQFALCPACETAAGNPPPPQDPTLQTMGDRGSQNSAGLNDIKQIDKQYSNGRLRQMNN